MSDPFEGWNFFTLDEANALVPKLTSLMERLQRNIHALRSELDRDGDPRDFEELVRARRDDPAVREFVGEIQSVIQEIEGIGCHFKGLDMGLVDFPAVMEDGEVVYYCWQHGESEVSWWHPLEGGFSRRQRISPSTTEGTRNLN